MGRKEDIVDKLNSLSREEFINLLKQSGFEVKDGDGRIIYKDE